MKKLFTLLLIITVVTTGAKSPIHHIQTQQSSDSTKSFSITKAEIPADKLADFVFQMKHFGTYVPNSQPAELDKNIKQIFIKKMH